MILKISHTNGKDILVEFTNRNYQISFDTDVKNRLFRAGFQGNVLYIEAYTGEYKEEYIKYKI
jgi:hypothetical protein